MKTVALVPIKFTNRRLPGKNTKLLGGKPLMAYIQETLLQVKGLDEVYIYCSDEKVQDYLIEGVRIQKRPDWLDGDDINANDIFVSFAEDVDADIYVIAHATAPFIKPEHIEEGIRAVKSGEYDSAFAAEKMQDFSGSTVNRLIIIQTIRRERRTFLPFIKRLSDFLSIRNRS